MAYPLSLPVSVGDATEAGQYNNLRKDAVFLGNDPDASGTLLQLLSRNIGEVRLSRLSAGSLQLTASAQNPCALMIGGRICAVTADMTIALPDGITAAGRYNVYAVDDGSGGFTLTIDTAAPESGRMIGTFLFDGTGIVPGTVRSKQAYDAMTAAKSPSVVNGRLTLASGTPVTDGDVSGTTVFFTPYRGNEIGLSVADAWEIFEFTEISLSLGSLMNERPYDIFIQATNTGLVLSATAWGSASARLTALVYHDGVLVSSANYDKRYLGTLVKNSSGECADGQTARLLWNEYNRVPRPLLSQMTAAGPTTVTTNYWIPYNAADNPAVEVLVPSADAAFDLEGVGISTAISDQNASAGYVVAFGIGQDIAMTAPFNANTSCVPVFTHGFGNNPVTVRIQNQDQTFRGYHKYSLIFWCNYSFYPRGREYQGCGEHPGLIGCLTG